MMFVCPLFSAHYQHFHHFCSIFPHQDEFYQQLQAIRQPWHVPSDTDSDILEPPEQDKSKWPIWLLFLFFQLWLEPQVGSLSKESKHSQFSCWEFLKVLREFSVVMRWTTTTTTEGFPEDATVLNTVRQDLFLQFETCGSAGHVCVTDRQPLFSCSK